VSEARARKRFLDNAIEETEARRPDMVSSLTNCQSTSPRHRYGRLVPVQLLESIRSNPEAWNFYAKERDLIDDGPQSMFDMRLPFHQIEMRNCPDLKPLLRRREGRSVSMSNLTELVKETVGSKQSVVLLDWVSFRGRFHIIGYNATREKICIIKQIEKPSVHKVDA